MKDSTLEDVVIIAALLTVWAVTTITRDAIIPLLALLLTLFGVRPGAPSRPHPTRPPAPAPAPVPGVADHPPLAPDLARLTVLELRKLARAAGLKRLARTGRRAELLVALAPA